MEGGPVTQNPIGLVGQGELVMPLSTSGPQVPPTLFYSAEHSKSVHITGQIPLRSIAR